MPLHCIAEGRTTSIYQYTYAYISYALGKLTASVIRLGFHGTRRSQLILREGGGDNLNIALNVGLWTPPLPIHFASSIMKLP